MCIYWGHVCIYVQDIKFLWSNLWLRGLSTDNDNNDDDDDDDDTGHHMTDNYRLHRLFSIYAKWANNHNVFKKLVMQHIKFYWNMTKIY